MSHILSDGQYCSNNWHHLQLHHADLNNDSLVTSAKLTHNEKGEFLQAKNDAVPNGWE